MSDDVDAPETSTDDRGVPRRLVLGAAAWSVPVITVASAAPALAASGTGGDTLTRTSPTAEFSTDQTAVSQPLSVTLTSNGVPVEGAVVVFTVTGAEPTTWLSFSSSSASTNAAGVASTSLVYGTPKPSPGAVFTIMAAVQGNPSVSTTWTLTYLPNLMVVRVGTGAAALTNAATAVFLDEYAQSGGTRVNALALPTAAAGATNPLTQSGTAGSEGALALSDDRAYLSLAGYAASPGTAAIAGTTSASVPRSIGRVSRTGLINTTTAATDLDSGDNPRGAASSDGAAFYTAGNSGGTKRYLLGASTAAAVISTANANQREVQVVGGDVFYAVASTTAGGVYRYAGLPQGAATPTRIATVNTANVGGFVLLRSPASTAQPNLMFVIDTGGIYKFSGSGNTWTQSGTGPFTAVKGTHLTGFVNAGGTVTLFVCNGSTVISVQDTSNSITAAPVFGTQTTVATAATNTTLRGVSLSPDA